MSSLPRVIPPSLLTKGAVLPIDLLEECIVALQYWKAQSGPSFNIKFDGVIQDLQTALIVPPNSTNPYAGVNKIMVMPMSLMYRVKEAFATWEYQTGGAFTPIYLNTKGRVYSTIDQYEMASLTSATKKLPIIL